MPTLDASPQTRPLTIVQVASNLESWGGLEIHLLNLGVQLSARGHRVIVACQPGSFVFSRAQSLGLEIFEATVRRQSDWTDFKRYREFLWREKVDVIHAHNSEDVLVPAAAARLAGVPVSVVTWHLPFPFKNRVRGNLILAGLHRRLIAISGSVRDMHIANGVSPRRIQVIHHGTDIAAFQNTSCDRGAVRAELGLHSCDLAVGIVGRVAPEKGHRVLMEALSLLRDQQPRLRVVVVGNGPDMTPLQQDVSDMALDDRVTFTGFREDVNNVIAGLDIVAVPSIWPEPCSAAIQQGMALSKPVVGSHMGGTPETIMDGKTGLLVPVSDPLALADALARLADDPALRRNMGEAGRARVEELFTLRRMTDEVENLYRREYAKATR